MFSVIVSSDLSECGNLVFEIASVVSLHRKDRNWYFFAGSMNQTPTFALTGYLTLFSLLITYHSSLYSNSVRDTSIASDS